MRVYFWNFVTEYYEFLFGFLCRRPRGTAFLKFSTAAAADAAVTAASAAPGLGIIMKGRPLTVLKALDKESAHRKELEKMKNEVHDRRNLYLAKVISPSSPNDMLLYHALWCRRNFFNFYVGTGGGDSCWNTSCRRGLRG